MICPKCGGIHQGGCKRYVESLLARIEELESLTKTNQIKSNNSLTEVKCLTRSNGFDKTAYQREYMRKWRAKH